MRTLTISTQKFTQTTRADLCKRVEATLKYTQRECNVMKMRPLRTDVRSVGERADQLGSKILGYTANPGGDR